MAFPAHTLSPVELAQIVAAEREGEPFLVYRHETGALRIHPLGRSPRLTIGRADENDVALSWDAEVSRAHAQLELLGGSWTLVDAGLSRNGSFVNSQRIAGQRRLNDGDTIRVGSCALVFRAPVRAAATTLAAGDSALPRLSEAERRVLIALCRGLFEQPGHAAVPASNRAIADELHLSIAGVKTQIRALFAKLGIDDLPQYGKRTELARRALELGLVTQADAQLVAVNEARPTS
jgi:DNA-binding CsgD family transcriptional regulator